MRYFEKISFEQFKKDVKNDIKLYEEYILPKRATKCSAGYDFYDDSIFDSRCCICIFSGNLYNTGHCNLISV